MTDGAMYRGHVHWVFPDIVLFWLRPAHETPYTYGAWNKPYFFVRTKEGEQFNGMLLPELPLPPGHNHTVHGPSEIWMRLTGKRFFSASNFRDYPVHLYFHANKVEGKSEGDFPKGNHIYIAVARHDVRRSAMLEFGE